MITDKQIEKAAIACADEYYVIDLGKDREETNRELFTRGAHWAIEQFLKELWHPSSEKPKKGRVFLYKTIFKGYGLNQIINGNEWKYTIKYQKATQWLYIDDLLPKEEDGNEKE